MTDFDIATIRASIGKPDGWAAALLLSILKERIAAADSYWRGAPA